MCKLRVNIVYTHILYVDNFRGIEESIPRNFTNERETKRRNIPQTGTSRLVRRIHYIPFQMHLRL